MGKARADVEAPKVVKEETSEKEIVYTVEAPNKEYNGVVATVEFKNGKGETSNKVILEYFKARGYQITKK